MKDFSNKKGFTLIETIVYIAIVTLVLGVSMNLFFNILGARGEMRPREIIKGEADFVLEELVYWSKKADSILAPEDQGSELKLEMKDASTSPIKFEVREGKLNFQKGGGEWHQLTTDRVEIEKVEFYNLTPEEAAGVIRFVLRLKPSPALGGRPELEVKDTVTLRQ